MSPQAFIFNNICLNILFRQQILMPFNLQLLNVNQMFWAKTFSVALTSTIVTRSQNLLIVIVATIESGTYNVNTKKWS